MQRKRENIELLKLSRSFKMAASEKEIELEAVLAKRKCLEDKRKNISQKCLQEMLVLNLFLHI